MQMVGITACVQTAWESTANHIDSSSYFVYLCSQLLVNWGFEKADFRLFFYDFLAIGEAALAADWITA